MNPPLPELVGRYTIRGLIGRGGMGMLYLAWDPRLEREVALKLLREGVDSEEMLERFSRESRSAARLRHPHIVTIFDVGEHEGRPYIAMEYVTGHSLAELVRRSEPLSVSRKIELLEELCSGLGYAHRQGIVHRDIKPANLMVDSEGVLKILDFGIARVSESMMTQSGVLIGTLNYMSPEQVAGEPVDPRSDIFAVGAVAYELFTYRMAFPGNLQTGILHKILHTAPEPLESLCPWLDADVVRVIQKALGKNPDERYQDLKAMRADLSRARQNLADQVAESTQIPPLDPRKDGRVVASTPVRSRELQEIERRRQSQIQSWLDQAGRLMGIEDYSGAVTAIENALLLDAADERALARYAEARAALDALQAQDLAAEAEQHLERGAVTLAEELIGRAMTLSPQSPIAARVKEAVAAVRRKREEERRVREVIETGIAEGSRLIDQGDFEQALSALQSVLDLAPDHAEAVALSQSAREAAEAQRRRIELARAREAATAARGDFAAGRHDAAIAALEAFTPPHELVTSTLDELRRQHAALLEQARVRQEHLETAGRALGAGDTDAALRALRVAENAGAAGDEVRKLRAEITRVREEAAEHAAREREKEERRAAIAAALMRARQAETPDAAIVALREVLRVDPEHVEGRRLLDEQQRALDQRAAAEREQERRTAAARGLVRRAEQSAVHADAVALLREAVLTDPGLAEATEALAVRERAVEAELAERRERERRRDESRRLVDRAAGTPNHQEAIPLLREALALDALSGAVQARLTERETALQVEEAGAAERRRQRKDARRMVGKAARTNEHAAAISLLREALSLDPEFDEARQALAGREQAQAAEIVAAAERQRKEQEAAAARRAAEKKRQEDEASRRAELLAAAEKKRQEEEAAHRAAVAAAAEKKRREEEAERRAQQAAAAAEKKRQDEEAARRAAAAAAERRREEEEAARRSAAAAAAAEKQRQEDEAARRAVAEKKRRDEEVARQAAAEKKRRDEEAARQAAAEKKRRDEEAARQAATEKRREEEEAARRAAVAAAAAEKKRQEDETARRAARHADEQRQAQRVPAPPLERTSDADQTSVELAAIPGFASDVKAPSAIATPLVTSPSAGSLARPAGHAPPDEALSQTVSRERPTLRLAGMGVKPLAAMGAGLVILALVFLVWRDTSTDADLEPLPMPDVPTSVPADVAAGGGQPGVTSAPGGGGPASKPVTSTVPAGSAGSGALAGDAGRAGELRRQAEGLLQQQPSRALDLAAEALRLQPADQASRQLLSRIALQARSLATQSQTRAAARTSSPTFTQAQRASELGERLLKQGSVEAAAKSWFDARAGFDRAAAEPTQMAGASAPTTIPAPPPPVTTSIAPPPATSSVPVAVPTSVPVAPPSSVPPAPTTVLSRPPVRNDQAAVQNVLGLYAAAYSRLDPAGIAAVYPGVDVAAIRNAFGGLKALQMTIENAQISVNGDTAVVSCTIRQVFTPRVGRGSEQRTPTRFELTRSGENWLIASRR